MKQKSIRLTVLSLLFIFISVIFYANNKYSIDHFYIEAYNNLIRDKNIGKVPVKVSKPGILSVDDIKAISKSTILNTALKEKLSEQLQTPYIVNEISPKEITFNRPYIRVGHWNIERGFSLLKIKQILKSPYYFYGVHKKNCRKGLRDELKKEILDFSSIDILCLNEVDVGMPRTQYKNIAQELAGALGWNYAFAPEFVEVRDIISGKKIDSEQFQGLHGNAIISRYPIVSAEVIRLPDFYNWYAEEISPKTDFLESIRKTGAMAIFKENILYGEVRRGNRNALIAHVKLPNDEIVSVISTHLEDRCPSKGRYIQNKFLLDKVRNINNPVILAGDFNTSSSDSTPTSMKREISKRAKDPHFLLRQAASIAIPGLPLGSGVTSVAIGKVLQFKDPAAWSLPVISPNFERRFFTLIKNFRFADEGRFDISGQRSVNGKNGLLASSNERGIKGFVSTFEFENPLLVAYFKLDWVFVKPKGNRFRPFNGQTLKLLNRSIQDKISDHDPLIVDITI